MHAPRLHSDVRHYKTPEGKFVGTAVLSREQLPYAVQLLINEGKPIDVQIPQAHGLVRLHPVKITDCRGLGASYDDGVRTCFELYEVTFCYGRR